LGHSNLVKQEPQDLAHAGDRENERSVGPFLNSGLAPEDFFELFVEASE
jgi:hypothetical protein